MLEDIVLAPELRAPTPALSQPPSRPPMLRIKPDHLPAHLANHEMREFTATEAAERWKELRPLLGKVPPFANGEYEAGDLLSMVRKGQANLLCLMKGDEIRLAMVYQEQTLPRKKVFFMLSVGGRDAQDFANHFLRPLKEEVKKRGVDSVRCAVRPAIVRFCKRFAPVTSLYTLLEI
jgi:hypothetical protein